MAELLHRAASESALLSAWREVQENDLADGKVNQQVADYARGVLGRLAALSQALRTGTWAPSPVYAMEIDKRSGGKRLLAVPAVEDRVVERALMEVVDDHIDAVLLPWSYAYRKGLSVADALHDLAAARDEGARWVVRADIKDCFEQVPRWPTLTRLREIVPDAELCHLIGRLVNRHGVGPAARRIRPGRGLHQGSSLSPSLTNLYLDSFDRDLLRVGHRVLRYSDDFAVPVATHSEGEKVLSLAGEALKRLDLELNDSKSRIESFDEGVDFLGKITTSRSGTHTPTRVSPLESTVYITEPGASLRTKGSRLRVMRRDKQLLAVPLNRVRQVVCAAPATLTTPFSARRWSTALMSFSPRRTGSSSAASTARTGRMSNSATPSTVLPTGTRRSWTWRGSFRRRKDRQHAHMSPARCTSRAPGADRAHGSPTPRGPQERAAGRVPSGAHGRRRRGIP